MCEGIADELRRIDLGDKRLNVRSKQVITALAANPKPLPEKPPVLSEFMRLLTQLGGDNNRAKELLASPQPLWTGLRRMTDFATAWLTFGPERGSCV